MWMNKNKFLTCSHDILLPMMFCQYQENCLPSGEDYFSCPIQSYDDCPSVAALLKLQYFTQYSDDRFWCVPFLQGVESLNSGSCVCVWSIDCKQTRLKPTCCIGPCYSFKQLISCCCKFSILLEKQEIQYCKHWCKNFNIHEATDWQQTAASFQFLLEQHFCCWCWWHQLFAFYIHSCKCINVEPMVVLCPSGCVWTFVSQSLCLGVCVFCLVCWGALGGSGALMGIMIGLADRALSQNL